MTDVPRERGFESVLYLNSATYESPTWVEVDLARDLTDVREAAEIDVTTRGHARRGNQAAAAGTTPRGFDFDSLVPAVGETNSAYDALLAALKARTTVDLLHVEGADADEDGAPATRMICAVMGGGKGEPIGGASTRSFKVRFTPNADQDAPEEGAMSGGDFVAES